MKYNIVINQKAITEEGLPIDFNEAAILDFLVTFAHTKSVSKMEDNGDVYYWFDYSFVSRELPMLKLKKDSIYRRFKLFCELGLIKANPRNQLIGRPYYAITERLSSLYHSTENGTLGGKSDPTDKIPEGVRINPHTPTDDLQDNYSINDNSTNDHIELDKSNSSCDPVFFEENMPLNEVMSTGTKEKKKGAGKSSEAYLAMVDFWLKDFHPAFTFGAMHGKSLKEIEKKINELFTKSNRERVKHDVPEFFKAVCQNLPDWFKDKDLPVINSKFNEIIQQLKNKNNGQPEQQAKFGYNAALKYRS